MVIILFCLSKNAYFLVLFKILMLEKLRLSAWKKTSVSAEEKEKEARDAPKMFENNAPSVTKGVKFAVSTFQ